MVPVTIDDIEIHMNVIIVKTPNTKPKIRRSFVKLDIFNKIVKKYTPW